MMKRLFFCWIALIQWAATAAQPGGDIRDNLFLFDGEDPLEKAAKNIFCRAEASKKTVFTGQPLVVTLKLYSALQSYSVVDKTPGFNGFSTYDAAGSKEPYEEVVNGRLYSCHIISKLQLYPLEAGVFTLDPVAISNTITFRRISGRTGFTPDEMRNAQNETAYTEQQVNYNIHTNPLTITVNPLPETARPDSFGGATGNFLLEAACTSGEADAQGVLTVTFTLSGTGNFKMINSLPVNWPPGVEAFEPEIKEEIDESMTPFAGKKTFIYTISPSVAGTLVIPPAAFSFFNPATGGYQTTKSNSIQITVNKAPAATARTATTPVPPATSAGQDANSLWWYAGGGLLALTAAGLIVFLKKRRRQSGQASVPAPPTVPERIPFENSRTLCMLGETGKFYAALRRELTLEAALALQLPAQATARDIEQALGARAVAPQFMQLVRELDNALYAWGGNQDSPEACLQRAQLLLQQIKA